MDKNSVQLAIEDILNVEKERVGEEEKVEEQVLTRKEILESLKNEMRAAEKSLKDIKAQEEKATRHFTKLLADSYALKEKLKERSRRAKEIVPDAPVVPQTTIIYKTSTGAIVAYFLVFALAVVSSGLLIYNISSPPPADEIIQVSEIEGKKISSQYSIEPKEAEQAKKKPVKKKKKEPVEREFKYVSLGDDPMAEPQLTY
jgi:HD superfamily phosphohydrolase